MKNPNIKTKVVHSQTKSAWNIVSTQLGTKYKIARIPYHTMTHIGIDERERVEAYNHAKFINWCFNNSTEIIK